jgi:hypothetical protein
MTQKKLYLLEFISIDVAKLCAGSAKIMRCQVIEFHPLGTIFDYIPDDVLGDPVSPCCPVTTDGPEDSSGGDRYSCQPPVYGTLDPDRHRDCADVVALANEIYDRPMPLPDLNSFLSQGCQFRPAQATAEKDRYHCDISDIKKAQSVADTLTFVDVKLDLDTPPLHSLRRVYLERLRSIAHPFDCLMN